MTPSERTVALDQLAFERRYQILSLKRQGPPCVFCRHGPVKATSKGICRHPLFIEVSRDAATHGGEVRNWKSTMTARAETGMCGPEGQLFEPRSAPSRVWRALRPHLTFLLGPVV